MRTARPRPLPLHVLAALGFAGIPGLGAGALPISFEPLPGQPDAYRVRGSSRAASVTATGPIVHAPHRVGLVLEGARAAPATGLERTGTRVNYFVGDRADWRLDVPNYARLRYDEVRPGVDLVYYGRENAVEFDLVAHPGSDPRALAFAIDGGVSAQIDAAGNLVIASEAGAVQHHRPVAFQREGEALQPVDARYTLTHDAESMTWRVGFEIGDYDPARDLVIDPTLAYSTYVGASGSTGESGGYIGADAAGNVYLGAQANSFALGGVGGSGLNVELYKFNPATNTIDYMVYLGGSGTDTLSSIAVDPSGNVYLAGVTNSFNFPTCFATTDCRTLSGGNDAFVMRVGSSGSPDYSLLLGGSATESAGGIAVDASGRIYVTGRTTSVDFPTVNAINASYLGGSGDVFVARIDPTPTGGIDFATYLGSSGDETSGPVAVDAAGNIYVGGQAQTGAIPLVNAAQSYGGGFEGFIMKLSPPPSAAVAYATYVGGSASDNVAGLAVDPVTGDLFAAGGTSGGLPVTGGAFQSTYAGNSDAFFNRYSASGALLYSTYLGASAGDSSGVLLPDGSGGVYLAGTTTGAVFPQVGIGSNMLVSALDTNAFLAHFNAANAVDMSVLLGGSGSDVPRGLAAGPGGSVWMGGFTSAPNFPMVAANKPFMYGTSDFFISRINPAKPRLGDFNIDSRGDIVLRNTVDGSLLLWLMNGTSVLSQTSLGGSGTTDVPIHVADFNGDGRTDLLWQDSVSGDTSMTMFNGSQVILDTVLVAGGGGWTASHVGDFNGDGKTDIVWTNTDGSVQAWLMNGSSVTQVASFVPAGSGWSVHKIADIDGDGKSDIFWRHTSGSVQAWTMDGLTATGVASFVGAGSGWTVALAADVDGDGKQDLVWQNTDGSAHVWLMNGLSVTQLASMVPAGSGYTATHAADLNGDGKQDLMWRGADGTVIAWQMGAALTVSQVASFTGAGNTYQITHTPDLNGDGKADLLWKAPDGTIIGWIMNGLTATTIAQFVGPGPYAVVPPQP